MRVTQGTFSFLPDLTDEQIAAQIRYCLAHGWAMSVQYTDDPHPRNSYWDMWGPPMFDLAVEEADVVLREVRACREAKGDHYVKLNAFDPSLGRQTTALSFVVSRPAAEPGFRLERSDAHDRVVRYRIHAYATDRPEGQRYGGGARGRSSSDGNGTER
jgi:ribulose-bisphosphate carboxylase small chain